MSDQNPYQAPESEVIEATDPQSVVLQSPRGVKAVRGIEWLAEGMKLFTHQAGPWVLICIVGFVVMLGLGMLNIIPGFGIITGLFNYVWLAGLMIGCQSEDNGDGIDVSHLFAGFKRNLGQLVLLALIVLILSFVIMMLAVGGVYWDMLSGSGAFGQGANPEDTLETLSTIVLPLLIGFALMLPLMMAAWFAPVLIALHDVPVFKAMKMSFDGCLRNILPFILYGIVLLVAFVIGAIPLMLGLLVVMPMFFGSVYASYKDIYLHQEGLNFTK